MIQVVMVTARRGPDTLKCARTMEDAGPNEIQAFKAEVQGFFRVVYREWAVDELTAEVRLVKQF